MCVALLHAVLVIALTATTPGCQIAFGMLQSAAFWNCAACSALSHTLCRYDLSLMMCFHPKSTTGLASSDSGGPTLMTYDPVSVLFTGYSAASQALAVPLVPVHLQGLPVPATYIFPDNDPGNAGLCRFEASLAAMPKEPVTPQQIAGQNSAIYGYYDDPQSTVYHALGNITTEVLVIAGTLDEVVSVQDDILIVDMIPGANFLQFADAGHAAILQHAVEAGEVLSAFLDA